MECKQKNKKSVSNNLYRDASTSFKIIDTTHKIIGDTSLTWTDTLVINYIKHTHNKLILLAKKDTARLEWFKDNETRNGTKYIVVEIGSDFEFRFIPRSWLYINSTSRKVYEYDIANDTLLNPK